MRIPTPAISGLARINAKEKDMKDREGIETEAKSPTPIQAIEELIGDEEQNENQKKKEEKMKQGTGPQPSYPGPFGRLLRSAGIIR